MSRRRIVFALAVVLVVASAYLFFELGRYQAGYALLEHQRETEQYRRLVAEQERTIEQLRRDIALLETSRDIDRETHARLESGLTELEAKLQAQEEELEFYRGIVSPPDGSAGLRVQSLEVEPGGGEQRYRVRLVLVQAITQTERVEGVVRLQVTGQLDGAAQTLGLSELGGADAVTELEYGFRYFQGLEHEITLPVGFEPASVEVEVRPVEPRGESLAQTFDWSAVRDAGREE